MDTGLRRYDEGERLLCRNVTPAPSLAPPSSFRRRPESSDAKRVRISRALTLPGEGRNPVVRSA